MNSLTFKSFSTVLVLSMFLFTSCKKDKCDQTITYKKYEPVYMSFEELRASVKTEPAQALKKPGKIYMKGEGVPADPVRAQMWFNLAASSKSPPDDAADLRDSSAMALPESQRLRADEMAHQCYLGGFTDDCD